MSKRLAIVQVEEDKEMKLAGQNILRQEVCTKLRLTYNLKVTRYISKASLGLKDSILYNLGVSLIRGCYPEGYVEYMEGEGLTFTMGCTKRAARGQQYSGEIDLEFDRREMNEGEYILAVEEYL